MNIQIQFTKEEIFDLIDNLNQCESEGYLDFSDPAYGVLQKLIEALRFQDQIRNSPHNL